jgi:hypothetical protein
VPLKGGASPGCSFCAAEAVYGPYGQIYACAACARRVGEFATQADAGKITSVWSTTSAPEPPSTSDLLKSFKRSVEDLADGEWRVHLATAYVTMALFSDALHEASRAMLPPTTDRSFRYALELLLSEPMLDPKGLQALRKLMTAG